MRRSLQGAEKPGRPGDSEHLLRIMPEKGDRLTAGNLAQRRRTHAIDHRGTGHDTDRVVPSTPRPAERVAVLGDGARGTTLSAVASAQVLTP